MLKIDKRPVWHELPLRWVVLLAAGGMAAAWYGLPGETSPTVANPPASNAAPVQTMQKPTFSVTSAHPDAGEGGAPVEWRPLPGEQLASDLAAQYRQPDQALLERHQGRQFRLLGRVLEQQVSGAGVSVVFMEAGPGLPPMRMVMAQEASTALSAGQVAALACLHGGMVMGEPLLRDCRLVRMLKP